MTSANALLAAIAVLAGLQDKEPIPSAAAQKEAEALIRDIFKSEYAKSAPADRQNLAKSLLKQGIDTVDDKASRYVLLREARDLSAQAGDAETALQAIDALASSFAVDPLPMRTAALAAAGKSAKTPEDLKRIAGIYLKLAVDSVSADDYDTASQAAGSSSTFAKRAKDTSLAARADARGKEISELKSKYAKVKTAKEKLKTDPDHRESNLVVGQFLCSMKGDWEGGLPMLAKGTDGPWKSQADKDLANPSDATEQAVVGNGWWDLAEKETGSSKERLLARALHWYEQAVDRLTGLTKSKVQKRISEVKSARLKGNWVDITDAKLFGLSGKPGDPIVMSPASGKVDSCVLKKLPDGEFDGLSAVLKFGQNRDVHGSLCLEGKNKRCVMFDTPNGKVSVQHFDGTKWIPEGFTPCGTSQDEYEITILIVDGEYVVYVDGDEKCRAKSEVSTIQYLELQADWGMVSFGKLRLRRKG